MEDQYRKAEGLCPLFEVFTPQEERRFIRWVIAVLALVGGIAIAATAALAHDPSGHNLYADWFLAQFQEPVAPNVMPPKCCVDIDDRGGDAHYVEVKTVGSDYYVKIGENWVKYPLPVNPWYRNPTGQNIAWYSDGGNEGIVFYCLRLATGT